MRIAQIVPPNATIYERKSARIDAGLAGAGDPSAPADISHVYAARAYITAGATRWWRKTKKTFISPIKEEGTTLVPEAVEEKFFNIAASGTRVGSILRPSVKNAIEQTLHRLGRTRDDIEWEIFDSLPSPEEISRIGVWVDPAIDDRDFDGGTAEALVAGCFVIGTRTPINRLRCEEGRTAVLVPANDPNEMTHAILSALFKPESGQQRATAARQTIGKFRPRQRIRVLSQLYEVLRTED